MKKKLIKILLCSILFLTLAIICKKDLQLKELIETKLYKDTLEFTKFETLYNKYLGNILPLEIINQNNTLPVFNEKLTYQSIESYKDGAKLKVTQNYLIPSQENGIIIYIGEKKDYGNVVIIETEQNINIWYGNICNSNIKLYDHLNKGDIIGETCTDELYLVYKQNNQILNYNKYIN